MTREALGSVGVVALPSDDTPRDVQHAAQLTVIALSGRRHAPETFCGNRAIVIQLDHRDVDALFRSDLS